MSEDRQDTPHDLQNVETDAVRPRLARAPAGVEAEARIRADLDRVWSDGLLAHTDAGAVLARDLEAAANLALPLPSEIDEALSRVEVKVATTQQEIEQLLSLDRVGDIAIEGMRLNELLDRGANGVEERAILRRGLLFLKRRMYVEASEWWILNRPKGDNTNSRLYLLLTLLLALTYRLSGDEALAQAAIEEANKDRIFWGRKNQDIS